MESPSWIAFDAVGTLIFADPPVHLAYYRIGRRHGSHAKPDEVLHRLRKALADPTIGTRRDLDTELTEASASAAEGEERERRFWRAVIASVLPDLADLDACFEELFAHFAQPTAWQCFADVEDTVAEARRRGCRLAIASNFDARLHAICDGLDILQSFDRRVISSEVGSRKPEPAFYDALLSACRCAPGELLFVGDDLENDVTAPQRAGIRSVHIDRIGATPGAVRSLCEAIDWPA
ncbi:MAG: HAD-IA family hydrolase [Planctomycetaceae bacterium]|nr:HAD-IA family hydrolase [Planctomycetaceae bacterium]